MPASWRGYDRPVDAHLQPVHTGRRSLAAYADLAGDDAVEAVRAAAVEHGGARVAHVTAAAFATAAVEVVRPVVALLSDMGVDARWYVVAGDERFTATARALRDGLRGGETAISDTAWEEFLVASAQAAQALPDDLDCVVLHDPQALGLASARKGDARWAWRTALDVSAPGPGAWERAAPLVGAVDAQVVAHRDLAAPGAEPRISPPALDPLSARHLEHTPREAGRVLRRAGVALGRPSARHAYRLDGWADVQLSLDAWRAARRRVPDLQLVVAARLAGDHPEGWRSTGELLDEAAGEDDLAVLTNATGLGDAELGALEHVARVALHASLRPGFGLAVSEALWKRTPVVARPAPGPREQLRDGGEGYLVEGPEAAGERIADLVEDPGLAVQLGRAGRERVRERFLVTRLLADELALLGQLRAERPGAAAPA